MGYRCRVKQVPIDLQEFLQCKSLFDSHAAFLRLLIPFYSEAKLIVYSDVDVVFQEDVAHLVFETKLGKSCLAMVKAGTCESRPERERILLADYGKTGEHDYHLSGLALIDRKSYVQTGALQSCKNLVAQHAGRLDFHDQTIWNCAIYRIANIHPRWCHYGYPGSCAAAPFELGIVHFVGSPKPWDLLGELFHPCSKIWLRAARQAGLKFPALRKYFHLETWRRAYRIRRQYRCWLPKK
jgi:lipopolysaccharide biosynthesis glycosyltransferase